MCNVTSQTTWLKDYVTPGIRAPHLNLSLVATLVIVAVEIKRFQFVTFDTFKISSV